MILPTQPSFLPTFPLSLLLPLLFTLLIFTMIYFSLLYTHKINTTLRVQQAVRRKKNPVS